jgi:hypothetical protein
MSKNLPALRSRGAITKGGGAVSIRGGGFGLTAAQERAIWRASKARKMADGANTLQAQAAAPGATVRDHRALQDDLTDQAAARVVARLEGRAADPAAIGAEAVRAAIENGSGPMKGRRLEVLRAGALLIEHAQATEAKRGTR